LRHRPAAWIRPKVERSSDRSAPARTLSCASWVQAVCARVRVEWSGIGARGAKERKLRGGPPEGAVRSCAEWRAALWQSAQPKPRQATGRTNSPVEQAQTDVPVSVPARCACARRQRQAARGRRRASRMRAVRTVQGVCVRSRYADLPDDIIAEQREPEPKNVRTKPTASSPRIARHNRLCRRSQTRGREEGGDRSRDRHRRTVPRQHDTPRVLL